VREIERETVGDRDQRPARESRPDLLSLSISICISLSQPISPSGGVRPGQWGEWSARERRE
jgi:hypothetical protein